MSEQDLERARAALARGDLDAATRLAKETFQRAKTDADRTAMGRARLILSI